MHGSHLSPDARMILLEAMLSGIPSAIVQDIIDIVIHGRLKPPLAAMPFSPAQAQRLLELRRHVSLETGVGVSLLLNRTDDVIQACQHTPLLLAHVMHTAGRSWWQNLSSNEQQRCLDIIMQSHEAILESAPTVGFHPALAQCLYQRPEWMFRWLRRIDPETISIPPPDIACFEQDIKCSPWIALQVMLLFRRPDLLNDALRNEYAIQTLQHNGAFLTPFLHHSSGGDPGAASLPGASFLVDEHPHPCLLHPEHYPLSVHERILQTAPVSMWHMLSSQQRKRLITFWQKVPRLAALAIRIVGAHARLLASACATPWDGVTALTIIIREGMNLKRHASRIVQKCAARIINDVRTWRNACSPLLPVEEIIIKRIILMCMLSRLAHDDAASSSTAFHRYLRDLALTYLTRTAADLNGHGVFVKTLRTMIPVTFVLKQTLHLPAERALRMLTLFGGFPDEDARATRKRSIALLRHRPSALVTIVATAPEHAPAVLSVTPWIAGAVARKMEHDGIRWHHPTMYDHLITACTSLHDCLCVGKITGHHPLFVRITGTSAESVLQYVGNIDPRDIPSESLALLIESMCDSPDILVQSARFLGLHPLLFEAIQRVCPERLQEFFFLASQSRTCPVIPETYRALMSALATKEHLLEHNSERGTKRPGRREPEEEGGMSDTKKQAKGRMPSRRTYRRRGSEG